MTRKGVFCEWDGIVYASISEAARACHIAESTMRHRLKCGYKKTSDVSSYNNISRNYPCIWNGKYYKSIADAARDAKIGRWTMSKRLKKGYRDDCDINFNMGYATRGVKQRNVKK